jgi:hypothetical protein
MRRVAVLWLALAASAWTACGFSGLDGVASGGIADGSALPGDASSSADAELLGDASATPDADAGLVSHIVFVTSGAFTGERVSDARCTEAVQASPSLAGRRFKAWLSYPGAGAKRTLADYGPWSLVGDGGIVANDLEHLVPSIGTAIKVTESGALLSDGVHVWTGTNDLGAPDNTCKGWTAGDTSTTGTCGLVNAIDSSWTDHTDTLACNMTAHLYCFEQPP